MTLDDFLNATARALLRVLPPLYARHAVVGIGRMFPEDRRSRSELQVAARRLQSGTCLSRALALAARAPGSDVVIGVRPAVATNSAVDAHAWLELGGERIDPAEDGGCSWKEIARFPGPILGQPSRG